MLQGIRGTTIDYSVSPDRLIRDSALCGRVQGLPGAKPREKYMAGCLLGTF